MVSWHRGGRRGPITVLGLLIIVIGAYVYWSSARPLPQVSAVQPVVHVRTRVPADSLAWPDSQAAVGIAGTSTLIAHGEQRPMPTASTAKLITALTVLQVKPLPLGQQGPTITLNAHDAAIYDSYVAQGGSVAPVKAGEKISEYQALQAMLLPSADNMADSLAIWAFGSLKNYAEAANQYLESEGLVESHVGSDASGLNPSTTSTSRNLVRIGELVMNTPVLAQIVGQPSASGIPVAGTIRNVNFLLGSDHIIGVKTGNSDQAGGVFVSASRVRVNGKPVTIVTAVMKSPNLFQALKDSDILVKDAQANFNSVQVVKSGAVVGRYSLPWGGSVSAVADQDLKLSGWGGGIIQSTVKLDPISTSSAKAGETVGTLTAPASALNDRQSVNIKLRSTPTTPSLTWRLLHPFK